MADDSFEEVRLSELIEVDVAELHDAEAVEGAGKICDGDGAGHDIDLVAGDLAGIEGQPRSGGARADEEFAPGKARRLIGQGTGHSP